MDEESKKLVEEWLYQTWNRLILDKPSNWQDILDFVIDDVTYASGYLLDGYFNSDDVGIGFRRFVERDKFEECSSKCCEQQVPFSIEIKIR